jgi:hypothetical protein
MGVGGTRSAERRPAEQTRTAPRRQLVNDPDELTHLVCCRDASWDTALCGYESESVNLAAEHICTMCCEVAQQKWAELGVTPWEGRCPVDGAQCPDEVDVDLRILDEVSPRP